MCEQQSMCDALRDLEGVQPFAPNPATQRACVRYLLRCIGEDPDREGLVDTPKRVVKALTEMTAGLHQDPKAILGTTFAEAYDEMVVVRNIRFTSLCEHHLLPFDGEAVVAYIPNKRVVGLSKIPRLAQVLAQRPQMQERLTQQIAHTLNEVLEPLGVGVLMRAHHSCMGCRGVRQPDADMVTSCLLGAMREPEVRGEFLNIARSGIKGRPA